MNFWDSVHIGMFGVGNAANSYTFPYCLRSTQISEHMLLNHLFRTKSKMGKKRGTLAIVKHEAA